MRIRNLLNLPKLFTMSYEETVIEDVLQKFYSFKEAIPLFRKLGSAGDHLVCMGIIQTYFKEIKLYKVDEAAGHTLEIFNEYKKEKLNIDTTCYSIIIDLLSDEYYSLAISPEECAEKREKLKGRIKKQKKEFFKKEEKKRKWKKKIKTLLKIIGLNCL